MFRPSKAASLVVVLSSLVFSLVTTVSPASSYDPENHRIVFPVENGASYSDTFGAPRSGGRSHEGQDLFRPKMTRLLATFDGRLTLSPNYGSLSGNLIRVTADDGYYASYMHVNNDTPGTDDGAGGPGWAFAPGLSTGDRVKAGQFIGWLGDSGNAEGTPSHVHFEIRRPNGTPMNPFASLQLSRGIRVGDRCAFNSLPTQAASAAASSGYWAVGSDGGVFPYGTAVGWGSAAGQPHAPIVGMAPTPDGGGYWLAASDGGIYPFGNAVGWGSAYGRINSPVVGIAATPTGKGYWLALADGGIFPSGDAVGWGSAYGRINSPVVSISRTSDGQGYWLALADGGVFPAGNAVGWGSSFGKSNLPIVAIAATSNNGGYWLLAGDGGIFPHGNAVGRGSIPGYGLCSTPASETIVGSQTSNGYMIFNVDGGIWTFGDTPGFGAPASLGRLHAPIVGGAMVPRR